MTKEEKEKLIELSDLNREDNVKYISSEAQGIAITLDSDRYAPTLCKLERAYICGRRKSENRITELEKEIAELKVYNEKLLDGDIEKHNKIVELQNRNGELAGQVASLNRWFSEAKGIIQDLLIVYQQFNQTDTYIRAERFLKEEEK